MPTIGARLRRLRERRGWSQLQVADKTGISNYNVSNYERGSREPDVETLVKFATLYDVSLDWLVTGKEVRATDPTEREWVDFKEMLMQEGVQWSIDGEELTPDIRRRMMDLAKFLISEQKKGYD